MFFPIGTLVSVWDWRNRTLLAHSFSSSPIFDLKFLPGIKVSPRPHPIPHASYLSSINPSTVSASDTGAFSFHVASTLDRLGVSVYDDAAADHLLQNTQSHYGHQSTTRSGTSSKRRSSLEKEYAGIHARPSSYIDTKKHTRSTGETEYAPDASYIPPGAELEDGWCFVTCGSGIDCWALIAGKSFSTQHYLYYTYTRMVISPSISLHSSTLPSFLSLLMIIPLL